MKQSNSLDGGSTTTKVVVLVLRPDGSAQTVNFERESALPVDFKLADSKRVSSVEHETLPGRLKFFFDRSGGSKKGDASAKEAKGEEDQSHD